MLTTGVALCHRFENFAAHTPWYFGRRTPPQNTGDALYPICDSQFLSRSELTAKIDNRMPQPQRKKRGQLRNCIADSFLSVIQ